MDIIYALSQMSGHAQGTKFARAEQANRGEVSPSVKKRRRDESASESPSSCSKSVLGYLCWRYTRALKALDRQDDSTHDQLTSSRGGSTRLAPFSKGEVFRAAIALRLLAAGARQHPVLRNWLWSVVAGLPEGASCVAMTLRVVRSQETLLLDEWAREAAGVERLTTVHGVEAGKDGDTLFVAAGNVWLSRVLAKLDELCLQFLSVAFPFPPHPSIGQPPHPQGGNFDHQSSEATASSFSIDEFAESLFSALDPADALRELPPLLSVYALLRSPSKRYLFVNTLLCNPSDGLASSTGGSSPIPSAEEADGGVGCSSAFDPCGLLSPWAYAWLMPLWSPSEDRTGRGSSSSTPRGEAKLIGCPPDDGGLSWLCASAALPAGYERRLHERLTRPLCGGGRSLFPPTPPPGGGHSTPSSSDRTSIDDDGGFTPDAYAQLRRRPSYEAALGVAAVLLAEHLQQTSVALSAEDALSPNKPQAGSSSKKEEEGRGDRLSRAAFAEIGGEGPGGASGPSPTPTPLERVLAMMQLDEGVVCGSPEGPTETSAGDPRGGGLLRVCNTAWTALVATLAIGEGIPGQFVRMCLDPLEVSLRGCPRETGGTSPRVKLSTLRDYVREGSLRNRKARSGKSYPSHIVTGTVDTRSSAEARTAGRILVASHFNETVDRGGGANDDMLTYRVIFPPPMFLLRVEDVALYTPHLPFASLSEMKAAMERRREKEACAEGMGDALGWVSDRAQLQHNYFPRDPFSDCPLRCRCVSSSMATVVAVALRHPRVEMFQLECIWQLLYYHHCNDTHKTAQPCGAAFHAQKGHIPVKQVGLSMGGKDVGSASGGQHDNGHRSGLHGNDLAEGGGRARSRSSERVQHERVEELGRRVQQVFDCFAYSALAGVPPYITRQQESNKEGNSMRDMRLDGSGEKYKPSTDSVQKTQAQETSSAALNDACGAPQETHLGALQVVSRKIKLNYPSEGARRVLKLELGSKETRPDSPTLPDPQDLTLQSRIRTLDSKGNFLNTAETTPVGVNNRDLSKNKEEWGIDVQTVLQLVAELSAPLEATGLSTSLQSVFDALLVPLEALWTTGTVRDMSSSAFISENTGGCDKRHFLSSGDGPLTSKTSVSVRTSLSLASSTKQYDSTCAHLRESNRTECTLQGQERRQLLSLTTPEYVKQFQDVLRNFFQPPTLERFSISSPKPGCSNANLLNFKCASLAVRSAMKATVGTILCFCIYRFLLHCYLQISCSSEDGITPCVGKEFKVSEDISIDKSSSDITFSRQEVKKNYGYLGISGGTSLTQTNISLQKKICLVLRHATLTLRPILQSYKEACLSMSTNEVEAVNNFYSGSGYNIREKRKNQECCKIFYIPISCVLLPKVLRAYETILKPMIHNTDRPAVLELSELKDMLRQYGVIL
ncbi:unnamed protein product [Phytomonas sp. EM1]|nr:unnamed protein product [Phytomonas sp. EM1]|eukprot:CCW63492.1 unnamed protein product [Phytomonas sp. isolate EM1]